MERFRDLTIYLVFAARRQMNIINHAPSLLPLIPLYLLYVCHFALLRWEEEVLGIIYQPVWRGHGHRSVPGMRSGVQGQSQGPGTLSVSRPGSSSPDTPNTLLVAAHSLLQSQLTRVWDQSLHCLWSSCLLYLHLLSPLCFLLLPILIYRFCFRFCPPVDPGWSPLNFVIFSQ